VCENGRENHAANEKRQRVWEAHAAYGDMR
jgi:hypothetical protein